MLYSDIKSTLNPDKLMATMLILATNSKFLFQMVRDIKSNIEKKKLERKTWLDWKLNHLHSDVLSYTLFQNSGESMSGIFSQNILSLYFRARQYLSQKKNCLKKNKNFRIREFAVRTQKVKKLHAKTFLFLLVFGVKFLRSTHLQKALPVNSMAFNLFLEKN